MAPLKETYYFKERSNLGEIASEMDEMRKSRSFTDLFIECTEGSKVHAHRIVCAARIPGLEDYLQTMSPRPVDLKWEQYDYETIEAVVQFAYTGKICLSMENVEAIFLLALQLQVTQVIKWCLEFMCPRVTFEGLQRKWVLACVTRTARLGDACLDVMKANFDELVKCDWFYGIPIVSMKRILADNKLNTKDERTRCVGALKWLNPPHGGQEHAKKHFKEVIELIEWCKIPKTFIDKELLAEKSTYIPEAEHRKLLAELLQKKRMHVFMVGKDPTNRSKNRLIMMDPANKREILFDRMIYRDLCAVASLEDGVYMIGGGRYSQDGFVEATNSVEMFSFKTRNTSSILPMRCKRSAPAAASSSNEIAVCGGWWNNTCELYQSSTGKWRDLPSMNEKRCDFSVVWLPDGQLIATGGYDDKDEILSSVEVLKHPWNAADVSGEWRTIAPMACKRSKHASAIVSGRVYVVGGCKTVEALTPPKNDQDNGQWTTITELKVEPPLCDLILTSSGLMLLGPNDSFFLPITEEELEKGDDDWHLHPKRFALMEYTWGATVQSLSPRDLQ